MPKIKRRRMLVCEVCENADNAGSPDACPCTNVVVVRQTQTLTYGGRLNAAVHHADHTLLGLPGHVLRLGRHDCGGCLMSSDNVIHAEHRFRPAPKIANADKLMVCPGCRKRQYLPHVGCLRCRLGVTPD